MKKYIIIALLSFVLIPQMLLTSCTSAPSIPASYKQENRIPNIFPDYTNVTIPCNIAPLNFAVQEGAESVVARLTSDAGEYIYGTEDKVIIDESEWHAMLDASKGKSIKVEVFAKIGGSWKAFKSFNINVSEDQIDEYLSYRLIQPSYVAYEKLVIAQRNLTNFEEKDIYNNMSVSTERDGQCINCHSYQNYHTDRMQFHMRQAHGGTIIVDNGKINKVNLKTDKTISAGVYPAWHPTLNLVAYSTNKTGQSFHTKHIAKIEVQDTESDLILYDVEKNTVTTIAADEDEMEIFPTWSPDGKTLYFCSAHFHYENDSIAKETEMIQRYKDCKYNLYKMSFDEKTHKFGHRELVYDAAADSLSVTLPRVSPDGRYIYLAIGEFGCFHVWHPDADIAVIDTKSDDMTAKRIKDINSDQAESYPCISSNGRWLMFVSRRDDGNYSRVYISYIDKNGKAHKAFKLPQEDPDFYTYFMKSYNRPEFMVEPVKIKPQEFSAAAKSPDVAAKYAE